MRRSLEDRTIREYEEAKAEQLGLIELVRPFGSDGLAAYDGTEPGSNIILQQQLEKLKGMDALQSHLGSMALLREARDKQEPRFALSRYSRAMQLPGLYIGDTVSLDGVITTLESNEAIDAIIETNYELLAPGEARLNNAYSNETELYDQKAVPVFLKSTRRWVTEIGPNEWSSTSDPSGEVHFTPGGFIENPDTYGEALSAKVTQCVDTLIIDPVSGEVLVGVRDSEPHAAEWVIGGVMSAGESVLDSQTRLLKKELGLEKIPESSVTEIGNYKFIWDSREQPPTKLKDGSEVKGVHQSSTLLAYRVDGLKELLDKIQHNEEYGKLRIIKIADILDAPSGTYHPCLVKMVQDAVDKLQIELKNDSK